MKTKLVVILLTFSMLFAVTSCSLFSSDDGGSISGGEQIASDKDKEKEYDPDEDIAEEGDVESDIFFMEEAEGAELHFKESSAADFFGKWESTSGQAEFMYGNVDLEVKESGSWTANIAGEQFSGSWELSNGSLVLKNEFLNLKLSFERNGMLIMQEDRDETGEYINTVLTKK